MNLKEAKQAAKKARRLVDEGRPEEMVVVAGVYIPAAVVARWGSPNDR